MGKTLAVVSGSGGTGKSTVAAELSRAYARTGKRTLLWELTPGTRCCDIILGSDAVSFDLSDILEERCSPEEACLQVDPSLWLLPSPLDYDLLSDSENVQEVGSRLMALFDLVILDPGCDGMALRTAARTDSALFCCTPTASAAAACERAARYVRRVSGADMNCGLVVNRVPPTPLARAGLDISLTGLIDGSGLPLRGVIPESDVLLHRRSGELLSPSSLESRIFDALALRTEGGHMPMLWK